MKKRVLAGLMMAVLMMASVMSVSANKSKSDEVQTSGTNADLYVVNTSKDAFDSLSGDDADAKAEIEQMNQGKLPESVINDIKASDNDAAKDIDKKLENKTLICPVFDLVAVGTHAECDSRGYHIIELDVPALKNCDSDSVIVLHYSKESHKWEVVTNVTIDGTKLTGHYTGLSPIAIFAKTTTGGAVGTSPKSGITSSTWMLWTAVAIVALGAGIVATQKKRG